MAGPGRRTVWRVPWPLCLGSVRSLASPGRISSHQTKLPRTSYSHGGQENLVGGLDCPKGEVGRNRKREHRKKGYWFRADIASCRTGGATRPTGRAKWSSHCLLCSTSFSVGWGRTVCLGREHSFSWFPARRSCRNLGHPSLEITLPE